MSDSMDEGQQERIELYERFKADISQPASQIYYDEDELVEIYDYAGDLDDDYVKMEVLLCGARLYPQSDPLRVRRAYFYYSMHNDSAAEAMAETAHEDSPLWDIIRLRLADKPDEEIAAGFDALLEGESEFDDETVIQLVDAASALNQYNWLKRNIDKIKEHCSYLQTLLYETAMVAEINFDYSTAVAMLEELTMIEPFNVSYWVLLAQEHIYKGEYEASLNAVDYALAIEGDNKQALILKAQVIYQLNGNGKEIKPMVEGLLKKDPSNSLALQTLSAILVEEGNLAMASKLLRAFSAKHPEDRMIVDCLLAIDVRDADKILDRYFLNDKERDESAWIEWARDTAALKKPKAAAQILECYHRNASLTKGWDLLFESLYRAGRYNELRELFTSNESRREFSSEEVLTYILSLMRLGQKKTAADMICRGIVRHGEALDKCADLGEVLREKGFLATLKNLLAVLYPPPGEEIPLDDVDPLTLY